jgi:hypothetical protein
MNPDYLRFINAFLSGAQDAYARIKDSNNTMEEERRRQELRKGSIDAEFKVIGEQ